MKRLIESLLGADYAQWKALTVAGLRMDFRTSTLPGGGARASRTAGGAFLMQLVFYGLLGLAMAMVVVWLEDRFTAALIVSTYVMFMIGTTMLLEHSAAITSPTHHAVLAFQPITSRTWFIARLTNVLVYTLAMTTAVGLLPAVAFILKHGVLVGLAALASFHAGAAAVTLVIIIAYASIVRLVGPRRMRSVLSWVQVVVGFLVYGGFFLFFEAAGREMLESLVVPKTLWVLLYPGAWFASWIEIAAGQAGLTETLPAAAAVALCGLLALPLRGRLSLEYAEHLGEITVAAERSIRRAARTPGRWFRAAEARAVALLVRAQFRDDMKFRMGVLGVVPLTLLYLFMGLRDRAEEGADITPGEDLSMITLAVMLFPLILKLQMGRSDAYRASWVFFTTPADRARVVRASKNVLVVFFLLPYLAFVGATLVWFMDSLVFTGLYVVFAGLFSHLVLQVITFLDPELPFAKPIAKGSTSMMLFMLIGVLGIVGMLLPVLLARISASLPAIAILFVGLVGSGFLIDRMTRVRVERQAERLEFPG